MIESILTSYNIKPNPDINLYKKIFDKNTPHSFSHKSDLEYIRDIHKRFNVIVSLFEAFPSEELTMSDTQGYYALDPKDKKLIILIALIQFFQLRSELFIYNENISLYDYLINKEIHGKDVLIVEEFISRVLDFCNEEKLQFKHNSFVINCNFLRIDSAEVVYDKNDNPDPSERLFSLRHGVKMNANQETWHKISLWLRNNNLSYDEL